MTHRRIAIYLDSRKPITQVQLNHFYSSKIDRIIFKEGISKTEAARKLLLLSFGVNDVSELKEHITYAANLYTFKNASTSNKSTGIGSKIGHVCKKAIKMAIDNGYLL
jgi:hypothetical protein